MISDFKILDKIDQLPAIPVALTRLLTLCKDKHSTTNDFEDALKPDPTFTANILHLANSAYFGCPQQVNSVSQAVSLVGIGRVLDITIAAALSNVVPAALPGYGIKAAIFWRHCVAVAVILEKIATHLDLASTDESFTCGVLHDIGKLVTGVYLIEDANALIDLVTTKSITMLEAEKEIFGYDHTEIGELVAQKWQLPLSICTANRWHHDPTASPHPDDPMINALHIADCLAHAFGYGADISELGREINPATMHRINLPIVDLEQIVEASIADVEELCNLY